MKILGIDPGFSGAWGMIDWHGDFVSCGDMLNDSKQLLTNNIHREISQARDGADLEICVEAVHSMPSQGVASTFKFGIAFGMALALMQRINAPTHMVAPQKWKRDLGLTSDKNDSLDLARKLWANAPLERKKDNGRAEALLLAHWWRLQLK
jgi:Holliday junction resolvasome RuvABC endonuclease subunit